MPKLKLTELASSLGDRTKSIEKYVSGNGSAKAIKGMYTFIRQVSYTRTMCWLSPRNMRLCGYPEHQIYFSTATSPHHNHHHRHRFYCTTK